MKKIIIILLLIIFLPLQSFADDIIETEVKESFMDLNGTQALEGYIEFVEPQDTNEVILGDQIEDTLDLDTPLTIHSRAKITRDLNNSIFASAKMLQNASKFSNMEYNIVPESSSYEKHLGNFSMGTKYDSDIWRAGNYYSTGLFSRYDGKHFALETGMFKGTTGGYGSYSNKIYFAPELKLGKYFSILNKTQSYVASNYNTNEIVLRYAPHIKNLAEEVEFEVGAGQYFSENTQVRSSLRFSTRFKL